MSAVALGDASFPETYPGLLSDDCGPHCGTKDGQTAHCRCCHAWSLGEADGCWQGWDGFGAWFDFAETHVPGSHHLDGLADKAEARIASLRFGAS